MHFRKGSPTSARRRPAAAAGRHHDDELERRAGELRVVGVCDGELRRVHDRDRLLQAQKSTGEKDALYDQAVAAQAHMKANQHFGKIALVM